MFTAILVLTIMIDPDHLVDLPRALPQRADETRRRARSGSARRAGRWCGASILPYVRGGVVAAVLLGLGRALGEAIAVTQVIGNFIPLQRSIFEPGDTLASRIANQYQGAASNTPDRVADLPRR